MPTSVQNRSKIDPRRSPESSKCDSEWVFVFAIDFNIDFIDFGSQHGLQNRPPALPKSTLERTKIRSWRPRVPKRPPGTHFGRFWIDLHSMLDRCWTDFGTMLHLPGGSFSDFLRWDTSASLESQGAQTEHGKLACFFLRSRIQRAVCEVAGFGGAAPCWILNLYGSSNTRPLRLEATTPPNHHA